METVVERILSHPLLTLALLLLCILLLYAVLKRLVKMLLCVAVMVVAYFGYVHFLEDDYPLPDIDEDLVDGWRDTVAPLLPDDWNRTFLDGNQS